jgi:hypothetical protein
MPDILSTREPVHGSTRVRFINGSVQKDCILIRNTYHPLPWCAVLSGLSHLFYDHALIEESHISLSPHATFSFAFSAIHPIGTLILS